MDSSREALPERARDARATAAATGAVAVAVVSLGIHLAVGTGTAGVDPAIFLMRPSMILSVILVAASLAMPGGPRTRWLAIGVAGVPIAIGLLTLLEYATGADLHVDWTVVPGAVSTVPELAPGRIPPAAAVGITLLAVASSLLRMPVRRAVAFAQSIAIGLVLLANLSIVSFVLGPAIRIGIMPYLYVPVLTGIAWLGLALAILIGHPAGGPAEVLWGSGLAPRVTRRLLVAAFLGIPVLGWIRLMAESEGLIDRTYGVAFLTASAVAALVVVALWLGAMISRAEEAAIVARTERLRFFDVSADMVTLVNSDGTFRELNPAWERILGWPADALVGAPFSDYVHPDDREATAAEWQRQLEGGPLQMFENRYRHRDGTYRWIEWHASRDAATGIGYASARDVTESRRETATLHAMFDSSPFGIALVSEASTIRFWSAAAERLFDRTAADVVGTRFDRLLDAAQRERAAAFASLLAGRLSVLDTLGRHRDGSPISIRLHATSLRANDHGTTGSLVFIEDLRERQQLEDALRQSQKMEAIGSLAGGIAHDFNNLLTAIGGYAELLGMQLPAEGPERADLEGIRTATDRAASLTSQLLAFSRRSAMQLVVLDPDEVLTDLVPMLRRLLGENIRLDLIPAPTPGLARVDRSRLEQVVINLAVNARDAMPEGGLLTIETATVDLDSTYVRTHPSVTAGRYVMIAVTDTGTGIAPAVLGRIFEPFFTTKPAGRGTGLGLSTADGIVRQSGGSISAYSELGRGTVFKVYLPLVQGEAKTDGAGHAAPQCLEGTETILLAEDEDAVRALCEIVLRGHGYRVVSCASGEEALDSAASLERIDLLLTDVIMTGITGRVLAERLAVDRPETRVLYVSGYTANAIIHHGVVDEGITFLPKPFTPVALARAVRSILDAPVPDAVAQT
jgi:PAS domain S-box-containing protein